jgi:type IX secretion system PorP/SprF family membrane protein
MKKLILFYSVLLYCGTAQAQQEAMFTHYMYNTLWLNPAYAGTRDALTATLLHRSQWVGFEGAPLDQTFTLHSPIYKDKLGAGLSILNDRIGPTRSTYIAADLAYQLKVGKRGKLGFGIKGLVNMYNNQVSNLKLESAQPDLAFAQNNRSVLPNVGAGLYYHRERFYVGLSTPKLLENKLDAGLTASSKEQRHYYFIMGGVINMTKNIKFKPTCFLKATAAAPLEGDFTANFLFNDKLTAGLMYRTGDAVGVLLGYAISDALSVGYSFDWSMANTTGRYNAGSHEVMLRYDLVSFSAARIRSPRYF